MPLYKIIPFTVKHGNCGGSLVQFQAGDAAANALPFHIGKVLLQSDVQPDHVRGQHAHYATEEIVLALQGGCTFDLDDGKGQKATVRLLASAGGGQITEIGGLSAGAPDSGLKNDRPRPGDAGPDVKEALLLYPHVWRVHRDFLPGTILLVVANMPYDEADYIRDRTAFERLVETWTGLGGSAE